MEKSHGKGKHLGIILGSVAVVVIAVLLVIAFVPGIDVFGVWSPASSSSGKLVELFMQSKPMSPWSSGDTVLGAYLEDEGYQVDVLYCGPNDVALQISQIEHSFSRSPDLMVIFPVNEADLGPVLARAKKAGIPVIAYNRLITGTSDVDYYASFDSYMTGVLQGRCIEEELGLRKSAVSFNIEIFAGSHDDGDLISTYYALHYSSDLVYQGAMSVLQPYIDSGKLVVKSGQIGFDAVSIPSTGSAGIQSRMDALLTEYFGDTKLDAILSPDDATSMRIIGSLKEAGYGSSDKPFPVLTGQGCELDNVRAIIDGAQSMSVYLDKRSLDKRVADMVDAIINGKDVPVNTALDNGIKAVPALLIDPVAVDITNYKKVLIESGYYTEEQLR